MRTRLVLTTAVPLRIRALLLLATALFGCRAVQPASGDPADRELPAETDEIVVTPERRAFTQEDTTVWKYLAEKYDGDGDGAVALREYDRSERSFKRLDRDGDGRLTEKDFEEAGRMQVYVTRMMLMRHFQDDDDPGALTVEEMQAAFDRHDSDGDGQIDEAELKAARASFQPRGKGGPRPMPAGMNPEATVLKVCDTDGNATISKEECEAFFRSHDDGDGVWQMPRPRSGDRSRPAVSGPAPGAVAPDFTLRDTRGRNPVTLSSHFGARPVALIFGSYT